MTDAYCEIDVCPTVVGNIAVYNHVSFDYALAVAPYFLERFDKLEDLPQLGSWSNDRNITYVLALSGAEDNLEE